MVPSPPNQPEANTNTPILALIEGVVPIPLVLSMRSKAALERMYTREHVSAREIRMAGASRSGVLKALDRFGIPAIRTGQPGLATCHSALTTSTTSS